jgi:hypothetical protein
MKYRYKNILLIAEKSSELFLWSFLELAFKETLIFGIHNIIRQFYFMSYVIDQNAYMIKLDTVNITTEDQFPI